MMTSPGVAAGTAPDYTHDMPRAAVGPDIEALLRKVEQQIAIGHTTSPPDDNAVDTWKQVLRLAIGVTETPGVHSALAAFVTHMRNRAADEMTGGRPTVANDLNVFAVQASRLVWHTNTGSSDDSPTSTSQSGPASQITTTTPNGAIWHDAPTVVPLAGSMPPAASKAALASPVIARPGKPPDTRVSPIGNRPAELTAVPLDTTAPADQLQLATDLYTRRGDEMLAANDIPAARKYYGYAAIAGNARAALSLARTYGADLVIRPPAETEIARRPVPRRHRYHAVRVKALVPDSTPQSSDTSVQ